MLRNYIQIAIRNLLRNRYFTAINILGLAIGLGSCILIFSYVKHELSYDKDHPHVDRTYRVNQTAIWTPTGGIMSSSSLPLAYTLKKEYPEVEDVTRINTPMPQLVRYDTGDGEVTAFYETKILAADSNFFSFFAFPLIEGDPETALHGANKVVLSEEAARKFFGDEPALGKTLLIGDDRIPIEVSGVAAKQPRNMHFHFDYLLSMYTNPAIREFEWSWIWTQVVTYVRLKPGTDAAALEKKFASLAERHVAPTFARFGIAYEDFIQGKGWNFYLQPLRDVHLYSSRIGNRLGTTGDIRYVYIFSAVGAFVMLLAIINFVNLATARAGSRGKEIGVKKVLGARRGAMVAQFQLESIVLTFFAGILSLAIVEVLRLAVARGLGLEIPFLSVWGTDALWFFPLLISGVGMLAGAYPAFYLTNLEPVRVLKGKTAGQERSRLRSALVVAQFAIAIGFIVATIIVYQQLDYVKRVDLGFNQENVLVINHADKLGERIDIFREKASAMNGVLSASIAMDVPGRTPLEDIFMREGSDEKYPVALMQMDEYYLQTLDMEVVAGLGFAENDESDKNKCLINETAARLFGWEPEEAVGETIIYMGDEMRPKEIKGVIRDFHFESLRANIAPAIFYHTETKTWNNNRIVALKITGQSVSRLVADLQETWDELIHDAPFEYTFLRDEWVQKYQQDEKLGGMFTLFTGLSLLIALIGMIGLVTYAAEQRRKEIGIRKSLGASATQMVMLLNGNFTKLILISFIIAVPLSWYAMHQWLEQFTYKVGINPWVYGLAGLSIIVLTWITVSYQSIRAALANPAEVLKDE
ncbi:MAG TPA: ABC transporter permease [Cyclobacteriaceae bacterium]|jgi:putative ABC transport system permease protein